MRSPAAEVVGPGALVAAPGLVGGATVGGTVGDAAFVGAVVGPAAALELGDPAGSPVVAAGAARPASLRFSLPQEAAASANKSRAARRMSAHPGMIEP
ncbi:MAG: hypothetical protein ACKVWR_08100 [Acidimicrobiales bacterium]